MKNVGSRVVHVGLAVTPSIAATASRPESVSAQPWTRSEPSVVIGVLEGAREYTFGRVVDVEIDDKGNVFVLDRQPHRITRYAPDGRFVEYVGRSGQGPGEYVEPTDIAIDSAGRRHVVDPANNRINIYGIRANATEYLESHRLLPHGTNRAAGSRRFVFTWRGDHLIHEIAADGAVLRSFGQPVEPDAALARDVGGSHPTVRSLLSQGSIRCDRAQGRILYVAWSGHVRMYMLDGQPVWATKLVDFVGPRMRGTAQVCCSFSVDQRTNTMHQAQTGAFRDHQVVISVFESGGRGQEAMHRYEIRVLRAADGVQVERQPSPVLLSAIDGRSAIGYRHEPFPSVLIWR